MSFNGVHKSYEICDSYTFKQNEVPIYFLISCKVNVIVPRLKLTSLLLPSSK